MSEIVLEIPEELKVMVPALQAAVETAMAQVERSKLGDAVAHAAFEQAISDKLREVERRAHEAALTALDPNLPKLSINKVVHTRVLEDVPTTFMTAARASGGSAFAVSSSWRTDRADSGSGGAAVGGNRGCVVAGDGARDGV